MVGTARLGHGAVVRGWSDRLAAAYGPQRSISALVNAMLTAPEFTAAQGSSVINPVEWLIGAVRALKVPVTTDAAAKKLLVVLRELGQVPFYPPNVSGWPSGQAWLSTAAADVRMQAATALAAGGRPLDAWPTRPPSARLDATAHLLGIATWSIAQRGRAAAADRRSGAVGRRRAEHPRIPDALGADRWTR